MKLALPKVEPNFKWGVGIQRREYAVASGGLDSLFILWPVPSLEKFSLSLPFFNNVELHSKSVFFLSCFKGMYVKFQVPSRCSIHR